VQGLLASVRAREQSGWGAAVGGVLLVWVYWSAQVFLIGAEFTRLVAERHGSRAVVAAA
jgi:membrane protein